jgi:hypothetical protein
MASEKAVKFAKQFRIKFKQVGSALENLQTHP